MLLTRDVRLITSSSQNSLTRAFEELQSYRPLFTEMSQREQVDLILYASMSTTEPFSFRKCTLRSCSLYRKACNGQVYPSSKQPQLSFVLPTCSSER
jgi:hypothetical protein